MRHPNVRFSHPDLAFGECLLAAHLRHSLAAAQLAEKLGNAQDLQVTKPGFKSTLFRNSFGLPTR